MTLLAGTALEFVSSLRIVGKVYNLVLYMHVHEPIEGP